MRALLCITGLLLLSRALAGAAAEDAVGEPAATEPLRPAAIVQLDGDINPISAALLRRRFERAIETGAKVIVLQIDSPGGTVYDTLELVRLVEEADVQTVAFIPREAISGAAILALACDQIAMLPRALLGDAGIIYAGEDAAFRYAPEKARSLLAPRLRALADQHGRPAALAEAMVDKELVVFRATHREDGTVSYFSNRQWEAMPDAQQWEKGPVVDEARGNTFFTATGARAVELGMAETLIEDRAQLASALGVQEPIPTIQPSGIDTMIVILNSSFVTWLLLVIGMIALVVELGAPGVGIGGLLSILCFGLFFWSRFLGGTSGWLEVILFVIGLAFVMLEIFVIPGVGVAGISGGLMILFSFVMASRRFLVPENMRDLSGLMSDIGIVLAAFIGFAVGLAFLAKYLGELPVISRLALAPVVGDDTPAAGSLAGGGGYSSQAWQQVQVGDLGQTLGPLRPSGKMLLGDEILEVVTEGDFVPADASVRVVAVQGRRVIVRQA